MLFGYENQESQKRIDKMKKNEVLLSSVIILILWVFLWCEAYATEDSLEFLVGLEKDTFLVSEPIWLDISATNIGEEEIRILPLVLTCMECLQVILINSKADTLYYHGIVDDVTKPPTGYLTYPGKTRSNCVNLLEGFGEKLDGFGIRHFLEPDKYSIIATYGGIIKASGIEFEVSVPKEDEREAYDLLRDGYDYHIQFKIAKLNEKLEELVRKYPNSVYADLAHYEMAYWADDPAEAEEYGTELLFTYPNSRFTRFAFWQILRSKTHNEQIQFLKDTIKKLPKHTRAFEWAQGSLEALEGRESPGK